MSVDYRRKLYALLQNHRIWEAENTVSDYQLSCWENELNEIETWWNSNAGKDVFAIADTSDRVNLDSIVAATENSEIEIRHPISGQSQTLSISNNEREISSLIPDSIKNCPDAKIVYHWFWRFLPEIKTRDRENLLLYPANEVLPDCPWHSYQTTVSALVGAMYPVSWQPEDEAKFDSNKRPYLFLFTFSPVQEFIKASRKFLDFWAGSYLLHYLGARLCWEIALEYGADAVITPSLWQQEIIDAFLVREFDSQTEDAFSHSFREGKNPAERFSDNESTSLVTAGFPNVITALVPGKAEAEKLGERLTEKLKEIWQDIALKVRKQVEQQVREQIREDKDFEDFWSAIAKEFDAEPYRAELANWRNNSRWTWRSLWSAQIDNTWEPYWTALPLGNPDLGLSIETNNDFDPWQDSQNNLANSRIKPSIATDAERQLYERFNVGTWWGSFQARLGQLIQSVKNTRSWQIATAPGERSSLSGQYSALHPQQLYHQFPDGGGLPAGSLRLFWRVMAEVFPGLFNGSEMLNAIELTKRMAWGYGGIAESLGVIQEKEENFEFNEEIDPNDPEDTEDDIPNINYEQLIRFPNLSSIAASRLIYELAKRKNLSKLDLYWENLRDAIRTETIKQDKSRENQPLLKRFKWRQKRQYWSKTLRKSQVPKTDELLKNRSPLKDRAGIYNGVMFSSKWLADDMGLEREQTNTLRTLVDEAHKNTGFINGSPSDWWVIVLGDGDGMGKYVSGAKLKTYDKYIVNQKVDTTKINSANYQSLLTTTKKRMGPATHVALNRALLDFSNRLVPYITERRFCGKVVYSGGDDVMAVLPLADLPEYLLSLRAAWSGTKDPAEEFNTNQTEDENPESNSGYWHPKEELRPEKLQGIPPRPLFTMGKDATMSLGIVIASYSVPLPTVLETLWTAEKERAKKMPGAGNSEDTNSIPVKDGLCFRVIYGSGNVLEALMKGHLLQAWWDFIKEVRPQNRSIEEDKQKIDLSPLLYRLAEELPKHTAITEKDRLIAKAAKVIIERREQNFDATIENKLINWLNLWEDWAYRSNPENKKDILGTTIEDLSKLLRFTAFWLDKMSQFYSWITGDNE